jgi:methyltransferase-like protein 6
MRVLPRVQAIRNVARTLRPGSGQVLFRDYAVGDLAQDRLAQEGRAQRIGDNFYARWDGTRAFYFSEVRPTCEGRLGTVGSLVGG